VEQHSDHSEPDNCASRNLTYRRWPPADDDVSQALCSQTAFVSVSAAALAQKRGRLCVCIPLHSRSPESEGAT